MVVSEVGPDLPTPSVVFSSARRAERGSGTVL